MLGRIRTPGKEANLQGNALGNQLRRKDILPSFRMFYSLGVGIARVAAAGAFTGQMLTEKRRQVRGA